MQITPQLTPEVGGAESADFTTVGVVEDIRGLHKEVVGGSHIQVSQFHGELEVSARDVTGAVHSTTSEGESILRCAIEDLVPLWAVGQVRHLPLHQRTVMEQCVSGCGQHLRSSWRGWSWKEKGRALHH